MRSVLLEGHGTRGALALFSLLALRPTASLANWPVPYPDTCAKVDGGFEAKRSIPWLQNSFIRSPHRSIGEEHRGDEENEGAGEGESEGNMVPALELLQVIAVVRHGARTPASATPQCWPKYETTWDCAIKQQVRAEIDTLSDTLRDTLTNTVKDTQNERRTDVYTKQYDAAPASNVLKGTCQKGQLLAEGYEQHFLMGRYLAQAYVNNAGEKLGQMSPLLRKDKPLADQIYFRSTDMQRTITSGGALLSGLREEAGLDRSEILAAHVMDGEREFLYPNGRACPALKDIKAELLSTEAYRELSGRYSELLATLEVALENPSVEDLWPWNLYDCLVTVACNGDQDQLPPGIRPARLFLPTDDQEQGQDQIDRDAKLDQFKAANSNADIEEEEEEGGVDVEGAGSDFEYSDAKLRKRPFVRGALNRFRSPIKNGASNLRAAESASASASARASEEGEGGVGGVSLLEATFRAVDQFAAFEYRWNDAILSKATSARTLAFLKLQMSQAILAHQQNLRRKSSNPAVGPGAESSGVLRAQTDSNGRMPVPLLRDPFLRGPKHPSVVIAEASAAGLTSRSGGGAEESDRKRDLEAQLEPEVGIESDPEFGAFLRDALLEESVEALFGSKSTPSSAYPEISSGKAHKLVLVAAHDSTVMPLLVSLGPRVFDDRWSPYASEVVWEIFHNNRKPGSYAFRLIYNGEAITERIDGCGVDEPFYTQSQVCDLKNLFKITEFATTRNSELLCDIGVNGGS